MDEKDRVITEIYNESKERARWERFELTRAAAGSGSEALKTKLDFEAIRRNIKL